MWDDQHVDLKLKQFFDQTWHTFLLLFNVAVLDMDVFSFDVTELSQALTECLDRLSWIDWITKSG